MFGFGVAGQIRHVTDRDGGQHEARLISAYRADPTRYQEADRDSLQSLVSGQSRPGGGDQPPDAESPPSEGPWISADLVSAPVGHPLVISGGGLKPDAELELQWFRIVGNRVSGQGWDELALPIRTVTTDADGEFSHEWAIPTDVGGPHRIEVRSSDGTVAETWVSVLVSAEPMAVASAPWGTDLKFD